MTKLEQKELAQLAQKAAALQKIWLHEREEQRQAQAAANAAIKQRWVESDCASANAGSANEHGGGTEPTGPGVLGDQAQKEKRK